MTTLITVGFQNQAISWMQHMKAIHIELVKIALEKINLLILGQH